jgi:ubiquinone/menaquinone biosynthesis C-methylase UbiE
LIVSKPAEPNAGSAVANTLAKPHLHNEWIAHYRNEAVSRFTADALGIVLRKVALQRGSKVLDAGCGSGTNSIWLASHGFAVTGVDFSDFALSKAREQAKVACVDDRIDFRLGDLTQLEFEDASFDAIFCIGVLMHIPQLEAALGELVRLVRPGGALIIAECNARAPETYVFRLYWKLLRRNVRVASRPSGIEVWSETPAGPLLSRKVSIGWLTDALAEHGMKRVLRMTGELTELYVYLRSPLLRKLIHAANRFWFRRRGLPSVALGNILAFRKEAKP